MAGPKSIIMKWDGEALTPLPQLQRQADAMFVIGQAYPITLAFERSSESHRHYFAQVKEAWTQLPEHLMPQFPNPDTLRKNALCRAGYCDAEVLVCASRAEAERFYSSMSRRCDLAVLDGNVLTLMWAWSQDYAHMGKKAFQESKTKVLDILAEMIGTDASTLSLNAGQAA